MSFPFWLLIISDLFLCFTKIWQIIFFFITSPFLQMCSVHSVEKYSYMFMFFNITNIKVDVVIIIIKSIRFDHFIWTYTFFYCFSISLSVCIFYCCTVFPLIIFCIPFIYFFSHFFSFRLIFFFLLICFFFFTFISCFCLWLCVLFNTVLLIMMMFLKISRKSHKRWEKINFL